MKTMKIMIRMLLAGIFLFIQSGPGFAQDDLLPKQEDTNTKLQEEMEWLKAETFVITASRVLENIKKSAASITVITDKQIEQMGAKNLMDVLRSVPGMSYMYYTDGQYKIDARGLWKSAGQNVLLMVNSHPLNENFSGGATATYDTIMLANVKRIEVIRGPGSALYGANAFAGVINLITKDAKDINGVQMSASAGSYQTQQYNLLFGKTFQDFDIVFDFNYFNTKGFERSITQDRQTLLDQLLRTHASLAPGDTMDRDKKYDASLVLRYKRVKFEGRYVDRNKDWPVAITGVLSKENQEATKDYYLTLSYDGNLREGLDFAGKVYRNYDSSDRSFQGYPPGAALPTPPQISPRGIAIFPEGVFGNPIVKNTRTGLELQTTYALSDTNTMVGGLTYEKMEQYDVTYAANFLYTPVQNVVIPLPAVQDITNTQNYNKDVSRTFKALFIEDLWDLTKDLRLTAGGRYDDYSDFGGSFNPRAGLIWEFVKGYDVKLLYGRAFRAPSFYEMYSQNNPSFLGNPDLKPEKIDTYELSLGAELTDALSSRITGFHNTVNDSIESTTIKGTRIFQNKTKIRSQGIETEVKYDFGKGSYVAANYTYQDAKNVDTEERLWNVPQHKGNLLANIRLSKYFNLFTDVYFQGKYTRESGDTRKDNEGFTIVNTTLIAKEFLKGLEIRGSIYNLFDKEYTYPTSKDSLPVDFPMPGRSFMVEVSYKF